MKLDSGFCRNDDNSKQPPKLACGPRLCDLAAVLGTTEQTLRLWEKHRTKSLPSGSADRLVRAFYAEYLHGRAFVIEITERLADSRRIRTAKGRWTKRPRGGWRMTEKIAA